MALPMVYGGPGRYVQGPGELSRQGRYLSWLGCAAYVLFDQGTEDRLCKQIVDGFLDEDLSEPFFKIYNGPCTEEAVVKMAKEAQAEYCDMVVGIGGGKMLDIAKAVAFYAELPLCVCPTAASMDGPCSAISVLYHEYGRCAGNVLRGAFVRRGARHQRARRRAGALGSGCSSRLL